MSPRRSSRARQTQPLPNHQNQGGSSSSASSNKNHRNPRPNGQPDNQMKSATPRSSSDEPDRNQASELDTRQTRQKKRELDTLDGANDVVITQLAEDEEADDGEVTRCICGQQEYPGPPEHILGRPCLNHKAPDNPSKSHLDAPAHPLLFESGSLFIQCETCHVWQHGGCVGIMDEAMSPEHYYCEECRESLHKIYEEPSGRKYSKYTRAYQDWECTRPSVTSKKSIYYETQSVYHLLGNAERPSPAALSSAKRRSTMNSRAAADEDEAFLKAIEESKSEGKTVGTSSGPRRGKRGREDSSEQATHELKRRKTGSESGSPSLRPAESVPPGSDTEPGPSRSRLGTNSKKGRGFSGQTLRDGLARGRERERDRERVEAATKRKGIENLDESTRILDPSRNVPATGKVAAALNPAKHQAATTSGAAIAVNRRGIKSGARRGRAGRNQYTKERDIATDGKHESPGASHSRDSEEVGNSDGHAGNTLVNGSKPSKPRHMNPNRTSMNDLRKRVAGILEYITRTQVEMAGDKTPPEQNAQSNKTKAPATVSSSYRTKDGRITRAKGLGNGDGTPETHAVDEAEATNEAAGESAGVDDTGFKDLSSLQMMDVLTRELVLWQKDYGKWGER